jgi:hypothetical protein
MKVGNIKVKSGFDRNLKEFLVRIDINDDYCMSYSHDLLTKKQALRLAKMIVKAANKTKKQNRLRK